MRFLLGLAGLLCFGVLLELVPTRYTPATSEILSNLAGQLTSSVFWRATLDTLGTWLLGLVIAIAAGVVVGVLIGSVPLLRAATASTIEFLRPIPSVALIPLALVTLGSGPATKISLAVFGAVWPILFNTVHAVSDIDPVQINTAKAFNLTRRQMLTAVKLPSIAPFVLTGIRVSGSIALILVVSTEVLAGGSSASATILERGGLGGFITDAGTGGARMDLAIAGTFVAGLIGFVINIVFVAVQRRWVNWSDGDRAR